MWTHEHSIETSATPERIWNLFADVEGWKAWNAGIEDIALHGPFVAGTRFFMRPPGDEGFTSTLVRVEPGQGFTDETVIDGTRVLVHHEIGRTPAGDTRITYRTEITGPGAGEFGPMVTADFPQVLEALRNLAELSTRPG
ncbi:MAG TPA: SRPBCC family protein [Xanthomonadaceae bacterium]|jgi:uncharacterized protein YndB with AHSA1/START domain